MPVASTMIQDTKHTNNKSIVPTIICRTGSDATLDNLIKLLEAIGCYEGAEICREKGVYIPHLY